MNQINEALEGLIQAIWEGEEYKRYQAIRAKVHEQPQLEQQIHAFRKKNYEVQNLTEEKKLYDQADQLEREGIEFRKDPLVNEYLSAELGICRLFQRINWELVQNMDFDLGFSIDS
ncbi:MAG: YlbF family regulator [Eubacterium sp.]|nr:YlbF family regulator [Eubacterium sp.]